MNGRYYIPPSARRRAQLFQLDAYPLESALTPGRPMRFNWRANSHAAVGWVDSHIELLLLEAEGGEQRSLWSRHVGWPPGADVSVSREPYRDWQPWLGDDSNTSPLPDFPYTTEHPYFDPIARRLVYQGFGGRSLLVRLTGTLRDGSTAEQDGNFDIDIVREPHVASWAALIAPAQADWNATYVVDCVARTDGYAVMNAALDLTELSEADGTRAPFSGNIANLLPGVRFTDHLAPRMQNWRWLEKPQYHADDERRTRFFDYTLEITWADEFGNTYPTLTLDPLRMSVRVSNQKWGAAAAAEIWFWFWVGVGAAAALAAVSFGIGAAVAGFAAATATGVTAVAAANAAAAYGFVAAAAGAVGAVASIGGPFQIGFWQEQADDPIVADPKTWHLLTWTDALEEIFQDSVKELSELEHLNQEGLPGFAAAARVAWTATAAATTCGRILSASASKLADAERQQRKHLERLRRELSQALGETQALSYGLFREPPTEAQLQENLTHAGELAPEYLDAQQLEDFNAALEQARGECERGAALLADPDYLLAAIETTGGEALLLVDHWLARHPSREGSAGELSIESGGTDVRT